jgi:predicted amidohydrolase YtcJ
MEGDHANYAEAVDIKAGKILFVGTKAEAEKFHGDTTQMNDLNGRTMMPGFVEPHVHPSIAATMLPNEIILKID